MVSQVSALGKPRTQAVLETEAIPPARVDLRVSSPDA